MIEIFLGDPTLSRKALSDALSLLNNGENVHIERFSDIGFVPEAARDALCAQNLFGAKNVVVFDQILDAPEGENFYSLEMKESPNDIYIREVAILKETRTIFEKIGTIHESKAIVKEKKQNSFAMADALVARDKKKAWVEYRRTVESGSAPEEIHGTIFWAMKMLYLCAHCDKDEAIKAGVSAYNYQRYLLNSKKYLGNELDDKLRELKNMYHDAHRGEGDLDALLEQFVLNA